jgi:hypothetical protein
MHMGSSISVLFLLAAAAMTGPASIPAPSTSGVYLTAEDHANGALTDAGSCQASFKVALHDVLNRPFIDVSRGAEKKQYAKSELFGVRLCDGHDYRFSANRLHRILATGDLYIYVVERPVSQGKGFRLVPSYYFSSGARGEVRPLTLEHLQDAFATNHRFIDSLDRLSDQDLARYDGYHQQFKIVRLLAESATIATR